MKWFIIIVILVILYYNLKINVSTTNASINSVLGLPYTFKVSDLGTNNQQDFPIKISLSL